MIMTPLASLLLLSSALLLPQDEAAPAGTSDTVREYLRQAESALYDPADDGLQSLTFVVPLAMATSDLNAMVAQMGQTLPADMPPQVRLGEVSVAWEKDGEPQVDASVASDLPAALNMITAQAQGSLVPMGHQVLSTALNQMVSFGPLLETFDARFDGAEGELLKVQFERKPGVPATSIPADTITWLFSQDDGLPVGSSMSFMQQGPMGEMQVTLDTRYEWKPARAAGGSLILGSVAATNELGSFATMRQRTEYNHQERDGVVMLVGYKETLSQETVMGNMPEVVKNVDLEALVVNGGRDEASAEG
jgi:hypothetical protein